MKRTISTLLLTIISLVILGLLSNKIIYNKPIIKNIKLTPKEIEFQIFFNVLKEQVIKLVRTKKIIEYKAPKVLDANLLNVINYTQNKNKVEFNYKIKYDTNKNKFNFLITAKTNILY